MKSVRKSSHMCQSYLTLELLNKVTRFTKQHKMILPRREVSFLLHMKCFDRLFCLDKLELGLGSNAADKGKIRESLSCKVYQSYMLRVFLLFMESGN